MRRIIFDKMACGWGRDDVLNRVYLRHVVSYLMDTYGWRKYLYLNEIYDNFGVRWNPDDENVCFKKPQALNIRFEPIEDGKYEIFVE